MRLELALTSLALTVLAGLMWLAAWVQRSMPQ